MAIEIEPFTESSTEPPAMPVEEIEEVNLISGKKDKTVRIGSGLQEPFRTSPVELVQCYADIFAYVPIDIPNFDQKLAMHKLHVDPAKKPIRQKRRIFA